MANNYSISLNLKTNMEDKEMREFLNKLLEVGKHRQWGIIFYDFEIIEKNSGSVGDNYGK